MTAPEPNFSLTICLTLDHLGFLVYIYPNADPEDAPIKLLDRARSQAICRAEQQVRVLHPGQGKSEGLEETQEAPVSLIGTSVKNLIGALQELCQRQQISMPVYEFEETSEGWLYLAVIIDLFSLGWSTAEHMWTELVSKAVETALGHRIPASAGLVFHSDRGSQYDSNDYQDTLDLSDVTYSMSLMANCWDNAVAKSFFSTLKTELIHPMIFATKAKAKTVIAEWDEVFYNRQRIHSTIGYLTPVQFEESYWLKLSN